MSEPFCVGLAGVRRHDLVTVGGKAANLGELIHAGFDVPPGFVVTTKAYRTAVGSARSRADVRNAPPCPGVEDAIRQAYRSLSDGAVAVRSSATAEDLPGAAFAGQQDTFLDVEGEDSVVGRVRDCWASLFTERAVLYRERLGIDPASVTMAVVVQAMVPADVAGVMFTAEPVTGARDVVVIDAAPGLGEAVVSGEVTPEHSTIDARGRIHHRRGGALPIMSPTQIRELAAVGRDIAEHFGRPQDIEWAVHDGALLILQTRAMTALPPPPIALNRFQRFIGPTLLEMLPRRPYPMELSAWIRPTVVAHVSDMLGQLTGARVFPDAMLPDVDGIVTRFVPPSPQPTRATPVCLARTVLRGVRGSRREWRDDPLYRVYRRGADALEAQSPRELSLDELLEVPRRATDLVSLMTRLRVNHLPRALVALLGLRIVLAGRSTALAHLIGTVPTMTRAANDELEHLARAARDIPGLRELLAAGDFTALLEVGASPSAATPWWAAFRTFLERYGHRETVSIMLVHAPAWVDSPATVLGMIRVLVQEKDTGGESGSAPPFRAPTSALVRGLARRAAEGVAFREDTHFELSRTAPAVRRAINEMGRRLVDDGVLDAVDDVWMLTLEEVAQHRRPHPPGPSLRATSMRRRTAWMEMASTPLIASSTLYPNRRASTDALVTGAAGGGGRASGVVRVIDGPGHFGELRAGEVLVCVATNPSWTPLFQRAAAVVVDNGGVASHAAIVAREYGIPAVMGAGSATSTLRDGQRVVVDGDRGEVIAAPECG